MARRVRGRTSLHGPTATSSWITVDRWSDRRDWDDFLTTWRDDYDALDRELAGLALDEVELFAGAVAG
jgi:hypothetical protein